MVIAGAGGHAIEALDIISKHFSTDEIFFFDNVSSDTSVFNDLYPIITTLEELKKHFAVDPEFVIAVGSPLSRKKLSQLCREAGGVLTSVISDTALIGDFNVMLGAGLNVMHNVVVTGDAHIGEGTLINTAASIHHTVRIGSYCEVSPGARVLGGCVVGNSCSIGANAVLLPNVVLGDNVVVGAGAVVTANVESGLTVVGIPAKPVSK